MRTLQHPPRRQQRQRGRGSPAPAARSPAPPRPRRGELPVQADDVAPARCRVREVCADAELKLITGTPARETAAIELPVRAARRSGGSPRARARSRPRSRRPAAPARPPAPARAGSRPARSTSFVIRRLHAAGSESMNAFVFVKSFERPALDRVAGERERRAREPDHRDVARSSSRATMRIASSVRDIVSSAGRRPEQVDVACARDRVPDARPVALRRTPARAPCRRAAAGCRRT